MSNETKQKPKYVKRAKGTTTEPPKKQLRIVETKAKGKREVGMFSDVVRQAELDAFIDWVAMPSVLRQPATQKEFCKKHRISDDTLTRWKKRDGFYEEVTKRRRRFFKDDSGDVILSLKRKCLKEGNGADVKVFLNYTEDLKDKTEVGVDEDLRKALDKISNLLPD